MAELIANARMYAVTPEAETAWRALLLHVAEQAGIPLAYTAYPAPAPLEKLWRRDDLGLVFMCGWPFAETYRGVQAVAAPIPADPRFGGRPAYASDLVVRADSPFARLEETFGHRVGWTVEHSQSGFGALRRRLLAFRTPERPHLYGASVGGLVTARAIVAAVVEDRIDVGPLDAFWHELLKRHEPETAARLRVIETTPLTPAPLLVAAPGVEPAIVGRLRDALLGVGESAPRPLLDALRIAGFVAVARSDYDVLVTQAAEAVAAGYPVPA